MSKHTRTLRHGHTRPKSRKRMNYAQNSSLARHISDLCISSVFLAWNLRSCLLMFAGSALYVIPGFEQLKTRLRIRIHAVLHCFALFCVVCVVLTRTMCKICVEYQWSFAKMLPLSRPSTTFHWRLADIWRMVRACCTYVSLRITEKN